LKNKTKTTSAQSTQYVKFIAVKITAQVYPTGSLKFFNTAGW